MFFHIFTLFKLARQLFQLILLSIENNNEKCNKKIKSDYFLKLTGVFRNVKSPMHKTRICFPKLVSRSYKGIASRLGERHKCRCLLVFLFLWLTVSITKLLRYPNPIFSLFHLQSVI